MNDHEFFAAQMRAWFAVQARDLAWRREVSPYRVFVSEIMLQQTQVATVQPYFDRWMAAFPTIEALAAADASQVMSLWAGLGYYRRARYLQQGARYVVEECHGAFPKTLAELKKIPGVGAYTAGAIASIAFGLDVPAIDGNAERVLARYFGIHGDLKQAPAKTTLEAHAAAVAQCGFAGTVNQAIMDLGASYCGKKAECTSCPVAARCVACQQGLTNVIPQKAKAIQKTRAFRAALCLQDAQNNLLIVHTRSNLLLGDLWTFPFIDIPKNIPKSDLETEIIIRENRQHLWHAWLFDHGLNCIIRSCQPVHQLVHHVFTHIDMYIIVDIIKIDGVLTKNDQLDDANYDLYDLVNINSLKQNDEKHPFSTLMKKMLKQTKLI